MRDLTAVNFFSFYPILDLLNMCSTCKKLHILCICKKAIGLNVVNDQRLTAEIVVATVRKEKRTMLTILSLMKFSL